MDEKVLKALCEPKRFLLLQLMAERGYCVRALAKKSRLSEPAVSQHLKALREADLVFGVKRGYYTHYSINRDKLAQIIGELARIRDAESPPCNDPYYGCSEAEALHCKSFLAPKEKEKG